MANLRWTLQCVCALHLGLVVSCNDAFVHCIPPRPRFHGNDCAIALVSDGVTYHAGMATLLACVGTKETWNDLPHYSRHYETLQSSIS